MTTERRVVPRDEVTRAAVIPILVAAIAAQQDMPAPTVRSEEPGFVIKAGLESGWVTGK